LKNSSPEPAEVEPDRQIRFPEQLAPAVARVSGVVCDSQQNFYLADEWNHRVIKLSADGTLVWEMGSKGKGEGSFLYPSGLCLHEGSGRLFVCDRWNHRIVVLDLDGRFVFSFGSVGRAPGQFYEPRQACISQSGMLVVVDSGNHRVQALSSDGDFRLAVGRRGSVVEEQMAFLHNTPSDLFSPPCFAFPSGVASAGEAGIAVLDGGNRRVQILTEQLRRQWEFASPSVQLLPWAIAADGLGFIFLLMEDGRTVYELSPTGLVLSVFRAKGPAGDGLKAGGAVWAGDGRLVVATQGRSELLVFDRPARSVLEAVNQLCDDASSSASAHASLVALAMRRGDVALVEKGVGGLISSGSAGLDQLVVAARGLASVDQPLNLYLLLSRLVHQAQKEREQLEAEQTDLLRRLEEQVLASARASAAMERAVIAEDEFPGSAAEAEALQQMEETSLELKRLLAKNKRLHYDLVKVVSDSALIFRERSLNEAFDFCLGVLIQLGQTEAKAVCDVLRGARNRVGEMLGLCKKVMAEPPEEDADARFAYLARFAGVLEASKGLHLGVFDRVVDALEEVLGSSGAHNGPSLARHGNGSYISALLSKAVELYVVGCDEKSASSAAARLIRLLLSRFPGLVSGPDREGGPQARDLLAFVASQLGRPGLPAVEPFVNLYLWEQAASDGSLIGSVIFEEAASVCKPELSIPKLLEAIRQLQERGGDKSSSAREDLLEGLRSARDSLIAHGRSWALLLLESFKDQLKFKRSPRAATDKAYMDLVTRRRSVAYGTIFEAHRKSLESCGALLRLIIGGMAISGDDGVIFEAEEIVSAERSAEVVLSLAGQCCEPLAVDEDKEADRAEALANVEDRRLAVECVQEQLATAAALYEEYRFVLKRRGLSLATASRGQEPSHHRERAAAFIGQTAKRYCAGLERAREWLWSWWGTERLRAKKIDADASLVGQIAASVVLTRHTALLTRHFLAALDDAAPWFAPSPAVRGSERLNADARSAERSATVLPGSVWRGCLYLYGEPGARPRLERFWAEVLGEAAGQGAGVEELWLGKAFDQVGKGSALTLPRLAVPEGDGSSPAVEELLRWTNQVCEYSLAVLKGRAARYRSGGADQRSLLFIDTTQDQTVALLTISCQEALKTLPLLAKDVVQGQAENLLARLGKSETLADALKSQVDEIAKLRVADELCGVAKDYVWRIISLCRQAFDEQEALYEALAARTRAAREAAEQLLAFEPPSPRDQETSISRLPAFVARSYRFKLGCSLAGRLVRGILQVADAKQGRVSLSWLDSVAQRVRESTKKARLALQDCYERHKKAETDPACSKPGARWDCELERLGLRAAIESLSPAVSTAETFMQSTGEAKGRLLVELWSKARRAEDKEGVFEEIGKALMAEASQATLHTLLGQIVSDARSEPVEVARAARLKARYSVRLVGRLGLGLKQPYGIATDDEGRLLIADFGNKRVVSYDRRGGGLKVLLRPDVQGASGSFVGPYSLVRVGQILYVSFAAGDVVIGYGPDGHVAARLGPRLGGSGLGTVLGLAWDAARGRLLFADWDGKCVWSVRVGSQAEGGQAKASPPVESPLGVAVSPTGVFAVSSYSSDKVLLFDENWELVREICGFSSPHLLAFGPEGSLFVADTGNDSVKRFSPDGEFVWAVGVKRPTGVWVDGAELLATSVETAEVFVWSMRY